MSTRKVPKGTPPKWQARFIYSHNDALLFYGEWVTVMEGRDMYPNEEFKHLIQWVEFRDMNEYVS